MKCHAIFQERLLGMEMREEVKIANLIPAVWRKSKTSQIHETSFCRYRAISKRSSKSKTPSSQIFTLLDSLNSRHAWSSRQILVCILSVALG